MNAECSWNRGIDDERLAEGSTALRTVETSGADLPHRVIS